MIVLIEDDIHCQKMGEFPSVEDAMVALKEFAQKPWDASPNCPPCMSWRTCAGRDYHILEFDDATTPWTLLRDTPALKVSQQGVEWSPELGQRLM